MAIKSVAVSDLPTRHREVSAEDTDIAKAVAAAASKAGNAATDGEVRAEKETRSTASKIIRHLRALNLVPAGKVASTRVTPSGDGFVWNILFVDAPAEPRKRKPRGSKAGA
jgi:hypothetical protein